MQLLRKKTLLICFEYDWMRCFAEGKMNEVKLLLNLTPLRYSSGKPSQKKTAKTDIVRLGLRNLSSIMNHEHMTTQNFWQAEGASWAGMWRGLNNVSARTHSLTLPQRSVSNRLPVSSLSDSNNLYDQPFNRYNLRIFCFPTCLLYPPQRFEQTNPDERREGGGYEANQRYVGASASEPVPVNQVPAGSQKSGQRRRLPTHYFARPPPRISFARFCWRFSGTVWLEVNNIS